MLKIISDYDKSIPIYFLNTGYHFPETLIFRNQLSELLGLNVIDLFSPIPLTSQKNKEGRLLYSCDTDLCCYYNKVVSLEQVLENNDVWISGVRETETFVRKQMSQIEEGTNRVIRYHPLLYWTDDDILSFLEYYNLPNHPLDRGNDLLSIGCQPCTILKNESGRSSQRWFGQNKEECGLHTTLRIST